LSRSTLRIIIFGTGLLLLSRCLDPYFPSATRTNYNYLVVDAFLTGGGDSTIVTLKRTQTLNDAGLPQVESDAVVRIQELFGQIWTLNNSHDGKYSVVNLKLTTEQKYKLVIITPDGKEYESDYVSYVKTPEIDSVSWKDEPGGVRIAVNTHDPFNNTHYYRWTYDETWQYKSSISGYYYQNGQVYSRTTWDYGVCWKSAFSKSIFISSTAALSQDRVADYVLTSVPQVSRKLHDRYSMLVRQTAISKEAYQYWLAIKRNNESLGNFLSPLPTQLNGNIHNVNDIKEPVLGFFCASTVTRKRILIDRQKISGPSAMYDPDGYENCSAGVVLVEDISDAAFAHKLITNAIYAGSTLIGYGVAAEECVDCRFRGGVATRPDYWGN
jgi:Domain of unknown function (DUF4249)